jgi:hypothetical protein
MPNSLASFPALPGLDTVGPATVGSESARLAAVEPILDHLEGEEVLALLARDQRPPMSAG